jgi:hypothetical protein
MSSKEVYDKTSNILAAIDKCGCNHCIALLKIGLVTSQTTDDNSNHSSNQPKQVCLT